MSRIMPIVLFASVVAMSAEFGSAQPAPVIPIDQVPTTCTKEVYQNPLFSIADAPRVVEGNDLAFPIARRYDDGCSHRVLVDYPDKSQLVDPPDFVDIPPGDGPHFLQIHTKADAAENGDRTVEVRLRDVQGGDIDETGRVAHGVIADPPPPEPTKYSIKLNSNPIRGQPLTFYVTRSGSLPAEELFYEIAEDGQRRRAETPLKFAAGAPSRPITLSPSDYGVCTDSIAVSLEGVSGESEAAFANLSGAKPRGCGGEFIPPANPWWPWWPWGVIGGIVVIGLCWGVWKWFHRPPKPDSIIDEFVNPDPDPEPDTPTQPITAECVIKSGAPRLDLSDSAIGQWPPIDVEVTLTRGIARVPDPLPLAEPDHG